MKALELWGFWKWIFTGIRLIKPFEISFLFPSQKSVSLIWRIFGYEVPRILDFDVTFGQNLMISLEIMISIVSKKGKFLGFFCRKFYQKMNQKMYFLFTFKDGKWQNHELKGSFEFKTKNQVKRQISVQIFVKIVQKSDENFKITSWNDLPISHTKTYKNGSIWSKKSKKSTKKSQILFNQDSKK